MKRYNLVISAFILLAGCQQQAKMAEESAAAESKNGGPKIEFESMVHDFGKVGPRKKLSGEFKFTNTGDAPLKITKVEKCCGAVTELDKEELKPGETGTLKVRYTSSSMPNKITKRLYVNSNDKSNPRATLTIKAETVLNVTYEPKSMKLMLKDENAGCPPITIKSVDGKPFSITSFQVTGESLTADIDPSVEATEFVLQPKAIMEELKKRSSGRINIGLSYSQPDTPPETITIIFRALSRFSINPSILVVFYDNSAEPVKKTLTISNNYGEDFEVESTSIKEGYIKQLDKRKVGNRYQFRLEITPPSEADVKRFRDSFTIKLKDGQTLEVPCRGIYRAPKK